jgi:hypothetical protein
MSISSNAKSHHRGNDDALLPLTVVGLLAAVVVMGWCVVSHVRPNMPHATMVDVVPSAHQ